MSRVHVHSYKRVVLKSRKVKGEDYIVYVCDLPRCNHQIAKEFVVGKHCICHRCGNIFRVTRDRLRGVTFLFCRLCVRTKVEPLEIPPVPDIMP